MKKSHLFLLLPVLVLAGLIILLASRSHLLTATSPTTQLAAVGNYDPATTIFVDNTLSADCVGNTYSIEHHGCSGSDGRGYKTIQNVAPIAQAGDTIYVRAGTYLEYGGITFANSGQPGAPITLEGYPADATRPIVQHAGSGENTFTISTPGVGNYIFKNLVLNSTGKGFLLAPATLPRVHDILFDNIEVDGSVGGCNNAIKASYYGAERVVIQNSSFHNCDDPDSPINFQTNVNSLAIPGSASRDIVIRNITSYNNPHVNSSGVITQEQGENFIILNTTTYGNGQYGLASKSGGYNIWLNNTSYNNGKGGYYLGGPFKDYGSGNVVIAPPSNYLLLNNVGISRKVIAGGGLVNWWRSANAWFYNNTLVNLVVAGGSNTPFNSAVTIPEKVYGYSTTSYGKNNIFYQAYGNGLAWYSLGYDEAGVLPRRYVSDYNLHYSVGTPAGYYKITGTLAPNKTQVWNENLDFAGWKQWFLINQGDAVDAHSLWADPAFVNLNPADDTIVQNLNLSSGSQAINAGESYGAGANDYPQKSKEFLAHWASDNNYLNAFDQFAILSSEEKTELRDYILNAYKYDRDGNPRDIAPDIGAYEYDSGDPPIILPPTCTYTYTDWAPTTCPASGIQTRTIASSLPSGCTGGNPEALTQTCTYATTTPTTTDPIIPPAPVIHHSSGGGGGGPSKPKITATTTVPNYATLTATERAALIKQLQQQLLILMQELLKLLLARH